MGDRLDREYKSILDDERDEGIEEPRGMSRFFGNLFDFNRILGEMLRLIIYATIIMFLFLFFLDDSKTIEARDFINSLDAENQTLGDVTIVGSEITLDEMLINTSDDLDNHFIKTRIVISYGSQETGVEINRRLNQIYDRVRKIISVKKFKDLKYIDGQELLSMEIKTEIQKITGKVDIYNIFFRDFTVY